MRIFTLLSLVVFLGGCAFVNVDIQKPLQPLQEKVLEGEGSQKILLLDITGFISEREQTGSQFSKEKPSTVAQVKEALLKAEQDHDVAGIILRINSPGGTVTASDIIHHEILSFKSRRTIPIYACITGLGTSGAYYVATAADRISAHPTAVTGSIGVLLLRFNVSGLLTKVGVSEETIKSGDKKDILSPFRGSTPEEQRIVQGIIDGLYGQFLKVILSRPGNQLTKDTLKPLADGRIYTAQQALEAKLIDRIGYLDDDISDLKTQLHLSEARIVSYYRPGSYKGSIYSSLDTHVFNFLNINADGLDFLTGSQFLYLWQH